MDKRSLDIKQAADILIDAKTEVLEVLSGSEHSSLSLAVGPQLDSIINRLYFMSGSTREVDPTAANNFPPVTNFMGDEIVYPKKISSADLENTATEKDIYLDKVDRLYKEFTSISPDGILNSFTLPEDQLVIRGVAKVAGVLGYEDKPINTAFIEEIASAIEDKDGELKRQKEIDEQLKSLEGSKPQTEEIASAIEDAGTQEEGGAEEASSEANAQDAAAPAAAKKPKK